MCLSSLAAEGAFLSSYKRMIEIPGQREGEGGGVVVLEYFVGGGRGRGGVRVFYIQVTTPQLVVPRLSSCGGVAVVFQSSSCPVLNPCVPSKGSYRIFVGGGENWW